MRLPILFNPASGTSPKDPDALLRPLPRDLRDRVEPIPFGPPWDFEPAIAQALAAEGPLLVIDAADDVSALVVRIAEGLPGRGPLG